MSQKNLKAFCRMVRARSIEHRRAIDLLRGEDLVSPAVSILRQEVDSLVRVIFLLSIGDRDHRSELIDASLDGRKWMVKTAKGKRRLVTDRDMVGLATRLHGWTESVYRFGCAFIHLSRFHGHKERDPLQAITEAERLALLAHLRYYHAGPVQKHPTFADVLPYLPRAFCKIADNLECYIKQLEAGEELGGL